MSYESGILRGSKIIVVRPGAPKKRRRIYKLGRGIVRFSSDRLAGPEVFLQLERKSHIPRLNSKLVRLSNSRLAGREVELYAIDVTPKPKKHIHKFVCLCGRRHR